MAKGKLIKTIDLNSKTNMIEWNFEENLTGKLIIESETYQEELLPSTIKIILTPDGEIRGGYITTPKKQAIGNEKMGFFRQNISAKNLTFLSVKVDDKRINYNIKINLYQAGNLD
ncbi:hypothetical protein [Sporocytophaga myxococcoides]|uniref:hypothetical protein n=1 Tax=Sporocytophaga myxococcoides TaxID=153721 RepID=UPI0003F57C7C|nr:hypothetical protein [Sporocytophaga myxococcoides]